MGISYYCARFFAVHFPYSGSRTKGGLEAQKNSHHIFKTLNTFITKFQSKTLLILRSQLQFFGCYLDKLR